FRSNKGNILVQQIRRQGAQWRDVVYDPNATTVGRENQIVVTRVDSEIADGNSGKMVAFELRPIFSSIDRDPKAKFGAEKEEIGFDRIFLDHMSVSTDAFRVLRGHERRPGFAVIRRFENIRRHVAKSMPIKRRVSRAGSEIARLDPVYPGILWQTGNVTNNVCPSLTTVMRELEVAVVRADPDQSFLFGRFADRINRGVHFCRRIVHGDTAGLFLLLFLRIVGGQVWRNAFPILAVVARAKKKLRADINRPLVIRRERDWRIPVEPELFLIVRSRLDVASFMRVAIYPANFAALIFGIDVIGISRIGKHPKAIAVVHIFPARIGDATRVLRVAYPGTVIL